MESANHCGMILSKILSGSLGAGSWEGRDF